MRIKFLQYATILRMFSDIMHAYNESLLRYRDKCSSLLHQQRILRMFLLSKQMGFCFVRKKTASQIFDQSDNDEEKTNLFVDNILEESRLAKLQLTEIQFRHNEIIKLEKSIKEIRDIFLEIAFSVEKQGEQLNCVEYFAGKATDDVEGGRCDLTKAEKRRRRNRKVT
ncbi:hypothetical protein G9C98_002135 [Cotesia typhae]|uniref:t-SNARE coiled-coil homology domain-containing protein n=1 Tax=Cotesia typhae TaxID=2053667 RepID=A0A8J5UTC2_9HYME|nr:hypothetical protein G9C98_002135 [Cotesia typhae]